MSPRSMVAVVVEENTMAIVTRTAAVPVVMVEGSIFAKQGDLFILAKQCNEYPFLGNSKKRGVCLCRSRNSEHVVVGQI